MNNEKSTGKKVIADGNEEKASTRIRSVRFIYEVLAVGYLICVVLQVFFAGMGVFVDSSVEPPS